jgi:phosphoribosyl-ATP pyrophosphohydrolase/phosphoribosyl-AMP cyclohydrolase
MELNELAWNDQGLVTVVVQDRHTGEVRMLAHADRTAIERTVQTGQGWFYSRSRQSAWRKGEESGNTLDVIEVWVDCDADAVLYCVDAAGPSCHTGARSCFYRRLDVAEENESSGRAGPTLLRVGDTLEARLQADAGSSYTRKLLDGGPSRIAAKVREEGEELAHALEQESAGRTVSETADVLYHAWVGLLSRGAGLRDVIAELGRRLGRSGHDEKAARPS